MKYVAMDLEKAESIALFDAKYFAKNFDKMLANIRLCMIYY